ARRSDRQESGGGGLLIHSGGHRESSVGFGCQTLQPQTEDPTMTDEMMNLQVLLEKSSATELLREMIGFAAQRLMELEVGSLSGPRGAQRRPAHPPQWLP